MSTFLTLSHLEEVDVPLLTDFDRLEQPWIYEEPPPLSVDSDSGSVPGSDPGQSTPRRQAGGVGGGSSNSSSSVSLGDTHIWRE